MSLCQRKRTRVNRILRHGQDADEAELALLYQSQGTLYSTDMAVFADPVDLLMLALVPLLICDGGKPTCEHRT